MGGGGGGGEGRADPLDPPDLSDTYWVTREGGGEVCKGGVFGERSKPSYRR